MVGDPAAVASMEASQSPRSNFQLCGWLSDIFEAMPLRLANLWMGTGPDKTFRPKDVATHTGRFLSVIAMGFRADIPSNGVVHSN